MGFLNPFIYKNGAAGFHDVTSGMNNAPPNKLGFTAVDNRVCVALSRARLGFFCACNLTMLSGGSVLWDKLLLHAQKEHRAGPTIPLATQGTVKAASAARRRVQDRREAERRRAAAKGAPATSGVAPAIGALRRLDWRKDRAGTRPWRRSFLQCSSHRSYLRCRAG